jgi:DNA polymerase-4
VWERVGLPITVGVARTKFLAKVASGVAKPDGLLLVPPDAELAFLHPLAVERLWGVGAVTAAKLREFGVSTVGEVAELPEAVLVSVLGRGLGRHLHALAHNRDPRSVVVGRRRGSIGAQRAIGRGPHTPEGIDAVVVGLVDRVTHRMRKAHRVGRTVTLRLRFTDYSRVSRSHTLARPTSGTAEVLAAVRTLVARTQPLIRERGLTLVGIAVGNLDDDAVVQLELPFDEGSADALDSALDSVHRRFGTSAVTRAVLLGRDRGPAVPLLPD